MRRSSEDEKGKCHLDLQKDFIGGKFAVWQLLLDLIPKSTLFSHAQSAASMQLASRHPHLPLSLSLATLLLAASSNATSGNAILLAEALFQSAAGQFYSMDN